MSLLPHHAPHRDIDSLRADSSGPRRSDPRLRIMAGYILYDNEEGMFFPLPLFNVGYRFSAITAGSPEPQIGVGLEAGFHYFFPYVQLGPEVRFEHHFFEIHAGGIHIPSDGSSMTAGASYGYVFRLDGTAPELQTGIESLLGRSGEWRLYLALGVGFR